MSASSFASRLAALLLAIPIVGTCASLQINSSCVLGNCSSPAALAYGTTESGSTSNNVTVNGDQFSVKTSYSDGSDSNGTFIAVSPVVTYTGTTPETSNDTITLNFFSAVDAGVLSDFSGTYNEHVPLAIPAGVTVQAQLFAYTTGTPQGIGLVGPYGSGTYDVSNNANLSNLIGQVLYYDYNFVFTFSADSAPGTSASSPAPEPALLVPPALLLLGLAIRRKRNSIQ